MPAAVERTSERPCSLVTRLGNPRPSFCLCLSYLLYWGDCEIQRQANRRLQHLNTNSQSDTELFKETRHVGTLLFLQQKHGPLGERHVHLFLTFGRNVIGRYARISYLNLQSVMVVQPFRVANACRHCRWTPSLWIGANALTEHGPRSIGMIGL